MTRNASIASGLALLLVLGVVAASCSGPGTTTAPPEDPATPEEAEQPPARMYRIQVHMTEDQSEAEQAANRARVWWRQLPDDERPSALAASGLDPEVVWQQPYYRVRIGLFGSRAEATPALDAVRAQFGDAFIVPVQPAPVTRR